MSKTLIEQIFTGEVEIESLTDSEQEQVLNDYNELAAHWAESPVEKLQNLGKDVLLLIEESGLVSGNSAPDSDTVH